MWVPPISGGWVYCQACPLAIVCVWISAVLMCCSDAFVFLLLLHVLSYSVYWRSLSTMVSGNPYQAENVPGPCKSRGSLPHILFYAGHGGDVICPLRLHRPSFVLYWSWDFIIQAILFWAAFQSQNEYHVMNIMTY